MKGAVVYYQPELETMPREELDALQLERLQKLVAYVYECIPFYRESFDEAGVKPEDIKSLDDLRKFPFTVKQDLRDAYPFGMFAARSLAFTALRAQQARQPWLVTLKKTLKCGAIASLASSMQQIAAPMPCCKLPMAMVCSRVVLALTRVVNAVVLPCFPCLRAIRNARCVS